MLPEGVWLSGSVPSPPQAAAKQSLLRCSGGCRCCWALGTKVAVLPRSYWRSNKEIMESHKCFQKIIAGENAIAGNNKLSYQERLRETHKEGTLQLCPWALNKRIGNQEKTTSTELLPAAFTFISRRSFLITRRNESSSISLPRAQPGTNLLLEKRPWGEALRRGCTERTKPCRSPGGSSEPTLRGNHRSVLMEHSLPASIKEAPFPTHWLQTPAPIALCAYGSLHLALGKLSP